MRAVHTLKYEAIAVADLEEAKRLEYLLRASPASSLSL
jgi:hypothetical protein